MPISRAVRTTRSAISPRFATSSFIGAVGVVESVDCGVGAAVAEHAADEAADGGMVGAASASDGTPTAVGGTCRADAREVGSWSNMRFSILRFAGRRHLRSHKNRHRLLWT